MADGDAHIVLPPELRFIMGPENGPASRLGDPLPPRLPDGMPDFGDDSEIKIDLGDGVSIRIGDGDDLAAPYIKETPELPPFGQNIAHRLDDHVLNMIGADIIQGVDADIASRSSWIDQYNKGIDLLGLKIEDQSSRSTRRNISRAGHPLMIEAMVKYQAGAAAELLPAAGPVKVPTIGKVSTEDTQLAQAFQDDFNYYLTEIAKEYYPDTRSMLMRQGYCGLGYKKVYRCPIRRRPVSESVLAPDLIVSEEATDLDNANRVTHRIDMMKAQMRRMQIVGHYRDISLGAPGAMMGFGGSANRKIKESEGISIVGFGRPEDQPYEILESDITLDIDEYGIDLEWERKTPEGMPLPYKIAVERNTQQVLGMWRIWKPEDIMCLKQNCYVKFGFIPGLGYHDWGFLQLLGNQTRVLRAAWRLMIDAGMFSLFPGGIKSKQARMPTNEIAPGPGEWPDVDIPAGTRLQDMLMPLPYKPLDSSFVQFTEIVKQDAMRLGNTTMLEVGEGRANTPVGTIMAILEDKVQVMADVFKNNHNSQKEELRKLRELFAENPQDLTLMCRERPRSPDAPYREWQRAEEFSSLNLVPASDPNVPARIMRLMVDNVLIMLAQGAPNDFDQMAVLRDVLTDIGKDPDRYLVRPETKQPQPPDPKIVAENIKQNTAKLKLDGEAKMQTERLNVDREHLAVQAASKAADNQTTRVVAGIKRQGDHQQPYHEAVAQHIAPQPPAPAPAGGIGTPPQNPA